MEARMLNYFGYQNPLESSKMGKFKKRKTLLDSVPVLVLLGLLAGAVGGLGVGLIQLRSLSQAASASSTGK
jgi:hypothetical protein